MIKKVITIALLFLFTSMAATSISASSLPITDEGLGIIYDGKEYRLQDLPPALQKAYTTAKEKASETLSSNETRAVFEEYINKIADASHRTINDVRDELLQTTPAVKEKAAGYYQELKERATDLKTQAEDTETGQAALNWYEKAKEKAKSFIESSN